MSRSNSLMPIFFRNMGMALLFLVPVPTFSAPADQQTEAISSQFHLKLGAGAITSLKHANGKFDTEYVIPGRRLGDAVLRYSKPGGALQEVQTTKLSKAVEAASTSGADGAEYDAAYRIVEAKSDGKSEDLSIRVHFVFQDRAV